MSLRSGRVGVNPEDVNPINGKIQVEAPDNVYTKTQADNKFETKTHAGNTYLTKTEAEALQPINLAVPVPLLDGSALTVESALQGLASDKEDTLSVVTKSFGSIKEGVTPTVNKILKYGRMVVIYFSATGVTADANDALGVVPSDCIPEETTTFIDATNSKAYNIGNVSGSLRTNGSLTNSSVTITACYICK